MPHGTEMETVVVETDRTTDTSTVQEQVDADEDRIIHGVEVDVQVAGAGQEGDFNADADVFIGTDPDIGEGDLRDLGGKLFARSNMNHRTDVGDGYAYVHTTDGSVDPSQPVAWEWNEDATLTVECDPAANADGIPITAQATVYYTEDEGL